MTDDSQAMAIEGVRFFGEMSASISHEIKNVLAIINENAGLLQDMVMMIEKGSPLSPERLVETVPIHCPPGETGRSDRQGHEPLCPQRRSPHGDRGHWRGDSFYLRAGGAADRHQGRTHRRSRCPPTPVTVVTNRFFLEDLVWTCLCRAMDARAPDQTVGIVAEKTDNAPRIRFCGLSGSFLASEAGLPSPRETMVAGLLGVQMRADKDKGEIRPYFPLVNIDGFVKMRIFRGNLKGVYNEGKSTAG